MIVAWNNEATRPSWFTAEFQAIFPPGWLPAASPLGNGDTPARQEIRAPRQAED